MVILGHKSDKDGSFWVIKVTKVTFGPKVPLDIALGSLCWQKCPGPGILPENRVGTGPGKPKVVILAVLDPLAVGPGPGMTPEESGPEVQNHHFCSLLRKTAKTAHSGNPASRTFLYPGEQNDHFCHLCPL